MLWGLPPPSLGAYRVLITFNRCAYPLFSPRNTYPHCKYQHRLDEGSNGEQRESDLEEHPDRMDDLVSEPHQVSLPDS